MRNILIIILLIFLPIGKVLCQKVINSSSIYLELSNVGGKETIPYFWLNKEDNGAEYEDDLNEKLLISLKNRQNINLYWKWINPLKYKVAWIDSLETDSRYEDVDKFISRIQVLFIPESITPSDLGTKSLGSSVQMATNAQGTPVNLVIPQNIKNKNINNMYFALLTSKGELGENDINSMNSLVDDIKSFEDNGFIDNQEDIKKYFKQLYDLNSVKNAQNTTSGINNNLKNIESNWGKTDASITTFETLVNKISLTNKTIEFQVKFHLSESVSDARKKLKADKEMVENLKPLISTIENSLLLSTIDVRIPDRTEYIRIKSFSFPTGKKIKSSLTIQKYDYDEDKLEFTKSGDLIKKDITFQKYNFIYPTFSTGVFYSTSSINTIGLKNVEDSDEFEITEDEIKKHTPSFAAFMNLNLDLKNDFFSPLIQFGLDPTKNRPFILSGVGSSIPVANFAFSFGGVWVFDQELKSLNIGDKVQSTTDLNKDITYSLNPKPQGFYIGIQYEF